jgi:hypothetical protein
MQQINLYQAEFQPNREPLRSIHMLWGLGLFVVLLLGVTLFSVGVNRERQQQLVDGQAKLELLKAQVMQLEQQRPKNNLAELDAQVLQLRQELERRNQIFNIIANKNMGNSSGFSAYLQAFGRQSLDTVSLLAFSLQQGGHYAEFAGRTRSADQVPLYVQRLRTETVFADSAFGVLNVAPVQNSQGVFDFSLAKPSADDVASVEAKTAVQMLIDLNKSARGEK